MMKHVVFCLEGKSEKAFLESYLDSRGWSKQFVTFITFEGKQDLLKKVGFKYKHWQKPNSQFVILVDKDQGDCIKLKQHITALFDVKHDHPPIVRM